MKLNLISVTVGLSLLSACTLKSRNQGEDVAANPAPTATVTPVPQSPFENEPPVVTPEPTAAPTAAPTPVPTPKPFAFNTQADFIASCGNDALPEELKSSVKSILTALKAVKSGPNGAEEIDCAKGADVLSNLQYLSLKDVKFTTAEPLAIASSAKFLDISNTGVQNLEGMQFLTKLEMLRAKENGLKNITQLKSLTQLKGLSLENNELDDASLNALSSLTQLSQLYISHNKPITNLQALAPLVNLSVLTADGNSISSLAFLASPSNESDSSFLKLKRLSLADNQLTDMGVTGALRNIQELILSGNQISTISLLTATVRLHTLRLDKNKIEDTEPLVQSHAKYKALANLRTLGLSGNQISKVTANSLPINSRGFVLLYNNPIANTDKTCPVSNRLLCQFKAEFE